MLSIAELAHKPDPKAIAEIICQELQPLDIKKLDVAVDIVDSSLELQIRTDSAIDKEKLVTLVHSKLQNLHIESVAKFRIHCWRNDEEMHEQRLLWTEQFMLDLPQSSPKSFSATETDLDSQQSPEKRSPEPQLSKHSVLQNAIAKLAPTNAQAKKLLLASDVEQSPVIESGSSSLLVMDRGNRQKSPSANNYWQLVLVGLSIVLLGLGIGALVRAITSKAGVELSSFSSVAGLPVNNNLAKDTTATSATTDSVKNAPSQITKSATANPNLSKSNPPTSIDSLLPSPTLQNQEQVVTLEKFNRIQKGMSVEQVAKIFGTSGKVIAENNSGNSIGQVYSWKNPEGSNAIIEFKESQVVAKAQAGL
jgi:hypothetical protein